MRFVLDQGVDVAVRAVLIHAGHDAWTADQANQDSALDDEVFVYADDRGAVMVAHDREFATRRRRDVVGHFLWLKCEEMEAATFVQRDLQEVVTLFERHHDLFIEISPNKAPRPTFQSMND